MGESNQERFEGLKRFQRPAGEETDVPTPGVAYALPVQPQVASAAAPRPTDVPAAVRWESTWEQPHDGTAIVTRRMARALDAAGIPVFLPPSGGWMRGQIDAGVRAEVETFLDRTPRTLPVQLVHLVPSEQRLRSALYPSASFEFDQEGAESRHRRMILFSVWEQLPEMSWKQAPMAVYLRKFAAHIVPCEMNAELLRRAGVAPEKIHVIAHPFDPWEAEALQRPRPPRAPGGTRFYTVGKWEPRKDPMRLLRAFLRASWNACGLHGKEPAPRLLVVTSDWWQQGGYPRVSEALEAACAQIGVPLTWGKSTVTFQTEPVPSMVPVHRENDVFVTSTCGEAWGMPAFDAVVAGNLVLGPRWGGLAEYLPERGELPYALEDVHPSYALPLGRVKGKWARVDEYALEDRMKRMLLGLESTEGEPYSEENFSRQDPMVVGQKIRRVVESVVGADYPWRGVL